VAFGQEIKTGKRSGLVRVQQIAFARSAEVSALV
jgi:hypothetical protein